VKEAEGRKDTEEGIRQPVAAVEVVRDNEVGFCPIAQL
jgi:hypothetical protein